MTTVKKELYDELMRLGGQMSRVMFNLSQSATVDARHRESMKEGKRMDYKIENGIKITYCKSKYPLGTIKVGQSFLVPEHLASNVRTATNNYARRHGHGLKFCTRKVEGGIRVWRIA